MTLGKALHTSALTLGLNGIQDSYHEARILLQYILKLSSAELYSQPELTLSNAVIKRLQHLMKRRISHEPNAYIVGFKEFYGADFYVDRNVMIPRPETEILVDTAMAFAKNWPGYSSYPKKPIIIADIGTGCGAIAVSLALNLPKCKIYATDISPAAIKVTKANCRHHDVSEQVHLLQGNLLEPLPEVVDLVVANLPYIRSSDLTSLVPEVASFEPRVALDGGRDGLKHLRRLMAQAKSKIRPRGCILLEIGDKQDNKIIAIAKRYLPKAQFELIPDLGGINRVAKIAL
jgi:release factor glutamine methyltransferase